MKWILLAMALGAADASAPDEPNVKIEGTVIPLEAMPGDATKSAAPKATEGARAVKLPPGPPLIAVRQADGTLTIRHAGSEDQAPDAPEEDPQ